MDVVAGLVEWQHVGDFKAVACGSLWKLSCRLSQPFVRTNLAVPWRISLGTGISWVSRAVVLFSGGGGCACKVVVSAAGWWR